MKARISRVRRTPIFGAAIPWNQRIGSYALANLSAQFKFMEGDRGKNATAFVAADNVFNRTPPWAHTVPGQLFALNTNPTLYDTVGTYVRAGIRFQF